MCRYEVMLSCWSPDASDRPTFQQLAKSLETQLERESGYLKLSESLKQEQGISSTLCPEVNELQIEFDVGQGNPVNA